MPDADLRVIMSPEVRATLAGLHDLQVSDIASALPWSAVGLALAMQLIVALLAVYWWRRPRQRLLRQLQHWQKVGNGSAPDAARDAVGGLAALLRRAAVLHARPPMPAGLTGDAWLRWLDARAPPADRGILLGVAGQWLNTLPYAPPDKEAPPDHRAPPETGPQPRRSARAGRLCAVGSRRVRLHISVG